MTTVRFAVPKGSIEAATFDILGAAYHQLIVERRDYRPMIPDPEVKVKILRPQEIPVFVAEGLMDVGITGRDWIMEAGSDVETLLDLEYGRVSLVLAVPRSSLYSSLDELLEGFWGAGKSVRLSTEYLNIASQYIASSVAYRKRFGAAEPLVITPWWKKGSISQAQIYLSFGATEAKPPEDADAIVDLVESGATLESNDLKSLETLMQSSALLIANKLSLEDPAKKEKIYDILTLLKGVVEARKKLHIFVNVKRSNLESLLGRLPALKKPTVSPLSDPDWVSVNTVVDRDAFLRLLPMLRKLAQGMVVHPPHQILPLEEIAKDESSGS